MPTQVAVDPDGSRQRPRGAAERSTELRDYCVRVARQYGAAQAAEDVAQDAMLAYLAAERVARPRAWLRTVVRRLVSRRFHQPHTFVDLEDAARPDGALGNPIDRSILLQQVLRRLSPRDRRILELKLCGYSYHEMAARLGCRTRSVGTLVNRAFDRGRHIAHPGRR